MRPQGSKDESVAYLVPVLLGSYQVCWFYMLSSKEMTSRATRQWQYGLALLLLVFLGFFWLSQRFLSLRPRVLSVSILLPCGFTEVKWKAYYEEPQWVRS